MKFAVKKTSNNQYRFNVGSCAAYLSFAV